MYLTYVYYMYEYMYVYIAILSVTARRKPATVSSSPIRHMHTSFFVIIAKHALLYATRVYTTSYMYT